MSQNTINACIDPLSILRDLDVQVNQLPILTTCPVCLRAGTFYACRDPLDAGGWYTCSNPACRFAGDSVALRAKLRHEAIDSTIRALSSEFNSLRNFDRGHIESYMAEHSRRERLDIFWRGCCSGECRENALTPASMNVLSLYRATDVLTDHRYMERLWPLFGYSTAGWLKQALNLNPHGGGAGSKFLHEHAHSTFLVVPQYDLPGRMVGIDLFADYHGEKAWASIPLHGSFDSLGFLDIPRSFEDSVVAIGDPQYAFCMQLYAARAGENALPLVRYGNGSDTVWGSLQAHDIILWKPRLDLDMFLTAKHLGRRARISTYPHGDSLPADPYQVLDRYGSRDFLGGIRLNAVPWLKALPLFLNGMSWNECAYHLKELNLSADDRLHLQQACLDAEMSRVITTCYETRDIPVGLILPDGRELLDRADCWECRTPNRKRQVTTVVMTARLVLHSFTMFGSRVTLQGHVTHEGRNYPFEVDESELTIKWLTAFCAKQGFALNVNQSIGPYLLYAAKFFGQPQKLPGLETVGWDPETKSFRYPTIEITQGNPLDHKFRLEHPHPLLDLGLSHKPTVSQLGSWFPDTPAHALFWACLKATLANILAPVTGQPTSGIAVMRRLSDQTPHTLEAVARVMHMRALKPQDGKLDEILQAERLGHPVYADLGGSELALKRLHADTGGRNNVLMCATEHMRQVLRYTPNWLTITPTSQIQLMPEIENTRSLLIELLQYFLRLDRDKLPITTPYGLADLVVNGYARHMLGVECPEALRASARMVQESEPITPTGDVRRFLRRLMHLVELQVITVGESERDTICLSEEHVTLNIRLLRKQLQTRHIQPLDLTTLLGPVQTVGLLVDERYGYDELEAWVLHRQIWNTLLPS
jgi:hypothetical protein